MDFSELGLPDTYRDNYARDLAADAKEARWVTERWAGVQRAEAVRARDAAKKGTASAARHATRVKVFDELGTMGVDSSITPQSLRAQAEQLEGEADTALAAAEGDLTPRSHVPRCRAEALRETAAHLEQAIASRHAETTADWRRTAADYRA